jgi:energy-coupling factor transporter ATP-binding protein EcfA2
MQRIVIIGTTGSGKSTFGSALADLLRCAHFELDDINWLPGWQERETADFRERVAIAAAETQWVFVGNYSAVRDLLWPRADTMIWIDLPFLTTATQLVRRTYRRNAYGDPCCNGNRESWLRTLGPDSILLWLLKTYSKNRRTIPKALAEHADGKTIHILRSRVQIAEFLEGIKHRSSAQALR